MNSYHQRMAAANKAWQKEWSTVYTDIRMKFDDEDTEDMSDMDEEMVDLQDRIEDEMKRFDPDE